MNDSVLISNFTEQDWPFIAAIYKEGIITNMATFETKIPVWNQWNDTHIRTCRLKAVQNDVIIGWAALSPTSKRKVYQGVAEVSIYITSKYQNLGIGKLLLSNLITQSEKEGFWTLQASIFSQNTSSIALHKSQGFRVIGFREKIGKLHDNWYDNTILERRSKIIL